MLLSPKSYKENSTGDRDFVKDEWGKDVLFTRTIVLTHIKPVIETILSRYIIVSREKNL